MKQHFTLLSLIIGIFFIGTDIAFAQSLENIIVDFSLFLRYIILPFLISIAFLYFLINMTKYFIIQGGSDEGRTKAKRSAIYGVAAFVFLFSIWGIVTWVVEGVLNNTQYETSLCPDYLSGFCSNDNRGSGPSGATFPSITPSGGGSGGNGSDGSSGSGGGSSGTGGGYAGTGGGSSGTGGAGSGSGGIGGGNGGGSTGNTTGLGELVFGTGKDSAAFTIYTGNPRSTYSAPTVANTATCEEGLSTLSLAARAETTQAAYVLYKTQSGAVRWENITDLNSTNHISYDRDVLEGILSGNIEKPHVIHTHPKTRSDAQGLVMDGHGPSAADMRAMCELNDTSVTYLTVDWTGVWRMRQQNDTCPYNTSAATVLPLLETYNDLASLDSSQREDELSKYTSSSIVPSTYKSHFGALDTTSFSSYTPEEIIGLSSGYQTYASTTIGYSQAVVDFCRTY